MNTRKIVSGKNEYQFINEGFSNPRSWGHKSTLLLNGNEIGNNKVTYLNRTWESYQYQSCMKDLVYGLIDQGITKYIEDYKVEQGIKRLKRELREELTITYKSTIGKDLSEVLNAL